MTAKCTPSKEFCTHLVNTFTGHQKGINPFVTAIAGSGTTNTRGIVFRKTEKDAGVLFNFCPFCGVDLQGLL